MDSEQRLQLSEKKQDHLPSPHPNSFITHSMYSMVVIFLSRQPHFVPSPAVLVNRRGPRQRSG